MTEAEMDRDTRRAEADCGEATEDVAFGLEGLATDF